MKCDAFRDLVFDYLEGALRERAPFEDHFAACPACASILRGIEADAAVLSRAAAPKAPADLWPRIAAAVSAGRAVRFARTRWAVAAAAAAAVLVASLFFAAAPAPGPALDVRVVDSGPGLRLLVPRYENVDTATALAEALASPFRND